jgi:nucleoside-diphosphate-sugar epimerase
VIAAVSPDVVVNCAGATAGAPDVLTAVNVTGTYALARAMLLADRPARLVHLGSAAEYGYSEPGVPVTESAPPRPAAVYGVTKLAGTRLVQLAVAAGLRAVVLRVFNPVGPGAPEESLPGRLAAELRRALTSGTEVRLGSLDAVRDFVDVRDVADAVLAAAAGPGLSDPVVNIGSGRGVPVRALVKELITISGYAGAVHEDASGSARSAGLMWQQADITRATADLGWQPRYDLAASLIDLWEATR